MSILKTALVTALLSSSTAAVAAPGASVSASADFSFATSTSPVVRDHRFNEIPYAMPTTRAASWSILSSSLQLRSGMDVIRLQGRQPLTQLRLQATTGYMQIDRVAIRFLDGTVQTVRMRRAISAEHPMLQLDLQANRSGVESISIFGHGSRRASYQVLAHHVRFEQPRPPRPIVNLTGTYTSAYGDVFLEQVGNRIRGEYPGKQGTIDGYISNGVAVVSWWQPDSSGRATFTVGANGKVEGTWGTGTSTNNAGEWDLYRAYR